MCSKSCMRSKTDPKDCRCECCGELHGSRARRPASTGPRPASSRRGKTRRTVGLTITAAATITIAFTALWMLVAAALYREHCKKSHEC